MELYMKVNLHGGLWQFISATGDSYILRSLSGKVAEFPSRDCRIAAYRQQQ